MTGEFRKPVRDACKDRLSISILEQGRRIEFEKKCLTNIKIFRKINNQDWLNIAEQVFSPYVDTEKIKGPAIISYFIILIDDLGKETAWEQFQLRI